MRQLGPGTACHRTPVDTAHGEEDLKHPPFNIRLPGNRSHLTLLIMLDGTLWINNHRTFVIIGSLLEATESQVRHKQWSPQPSIEAVFYKNNSGCAGAREPFVIAGT